MLEKASLDFLKALKKNNHKAWFDAHRDQYERTKSNVIELAEYAIQELSKIDSRYQELEAKKCLFRIHRDVRFSKNKDPYKTNIGAAFSIGGKNSAGGGFYIHIEPNACFIGGGIWQPEPEYLKKIRQEIDYNQKEFKGIVEGKKFQSAFETLSMDDSLARPPKGYEADHPMLAYLKLKHYVASRRVSDEVMMDKAFKKEMLLSFQALMPLIKFIEKAITD